MKDDISKTIQQNNPVVDALEDPSVAPTSELIPEDTFNYDGYQVVRGEFFAHMYEPSIVFTDCKIYVNSACVNKLPDVYYVQILVNPDEMKLAVRPCNEDEKDSFVWCRSTRGKRTPKQITCRVFFAKIIQLMDWNSNYRYKLLGKLIHSNDEYLFVFDLKAPEIFQRIVYDGGKTISSRSPMFPAEWQNQFGQPMEEHRKSLQVNIFDGFAVFGIKNTPGVSEITNCEQSRNEKEVAVICGN